MIPINKPNDITFRGKINSDVINSNSKSTEFDMLEIFNRMNKLTSKIDHIKEVNDVESIYSSIVIDKMQKEIDKMNSLNGTISIHPIDTYSYSGIDSANIDTLYNEISVPISFNESKLYVHDEFSNKKFLPKSFKASVENLSKIPMKHNDINKAFNGDINDKFVCYLYGDENTTSASISITITLPEDAISNKDINYISINPFPYKSVRVDNIEHKMFSNWEQIPSFNEHCNSKYESSKVVIEDAPNLKFIFNHITANQIRIFLTQDKFYTDKEGRRVFCIGISNFEVLNIKHTSDVAVFYSKIEFDNKDTKTIKSINTSLNNSTQVGKNTIQYEFYNLDEDDNPTKIEDGIPFKINNDKMLLKVLIHRQNVSPSISKIAISYE